MGARADHAEVNEPAAARDGGVATRQLSSVEQLGATAGNAAVSGLIAGARSAPLPPSAPSPPPDLHYVPPRREGGWLTPLQRLGAAPSVVPAAPAPSIGIVPAPAVQRVAPTEVLDTEAAEVQARRPGHFDDSRSAGGTEFEGLQTTTADGLAGESEGADRPTSGEVGSFTVSRLARPASPAGSTMPAGALSTSPTAVDVRVAPARGPPGSAVQTSGSEAPAHAGWATEPTRTNFESLPGAEATGAPAVGMIPQNGPGETAVFSAATDQDEDVISGTGRPVGGGQHTTGGPVEVERLAIASASPTRTATTPGVASVVHRRRRGAEESPAGEATVEQGAEAAATAVQRWSRVLQRSGGGRGQSPDLGPMQGPPPSVTHVQRSGCAGGCGCGPCLDDDEQRTTREIDTVQRAFADEFLRAGALDQSRHEAAPDGGAARVGFDRVRRCQTQCLARASRRAAQHVHLPPLQHGPLVAQRVSSVGGYGCGPCAKDDEARSPHSDLPVQCRTDRATPKLIQRVSLNPLDALKAVSEAGIPQDRGAYVLRQLRRRLGRSGGSDRRDPRGGSRAGGRRKRRDCCQHRGRGGGISCDIRRYSRCQCGADDRHRRRSQRPGRRVD